MSGNKLLLDTNEILYLLNGDRSVLLHVKDAEIIVSIITEIELLSSKELKEKEERQIRKFLDDCLILDILPQIKNNSILLRKKYGLKLPDAVIVLTAYTFNIPIITADKKLFKVDEIEVIKIHANAS